MTAPGQRKPRRASARPGKGDRNETTQLPDAAEGKASIASADSAEQSPASRCLRAASELIALGWRVFPLLGKEPAGLLVASGFQDATSDLDQVRRWWQQHPRLNLGAVPPEGCFVVDLDHYKDRAALEPLGERLRALGGPVQRSGGGGLHFLLRGVPPSTRDVQRQFGVSTGIEVKAHAKGYIVVAPSIHPDTGAEYCWEVPPTATVPDAPAWLGVRPANDDRDDAASTSKPALGIDIVAARELLDHLPHRWVDEYDDWLRAGMALHHEFDGGEQALELFDEWSRRAPDKYQPDACALKWSTFGQPGKNDVTMRTLLREAQATGWRAPLTIERAVRDFTAVDWLRDARAARFDLSKPPPPVDWLFDGTIRNAKLTILAGAGGSSKSFFALALAAHWAAGRPFDAFVPTCRDPDSDEVLLLYAEEDELDLHHRFAATMGAAGFTAAQQEQVGRRLLLRSLFDIERGTVLAHYEPRSRSVQRGPLFELLARTFKTRPQLRWVVMDPLVLLHHLDENDNGAMAHVLGELGDLAREHCVAIWLVHHLSKSGAQADDSNSQQVRGASAIVDNARALVLLRRLTALDAGTVGATAEEARQMVRLSLPKHNHSAPLPDRYFRIDEDTGAVRPMEVQPMTVPASARRAVRQLVVREQAADFREAACLRAVLEALDLKPLGTNDIYAAKPGGAGRKIIDPVLEGAIADGLVAVKTGPRGKKLHHTTDEGRRRLEELGVPAADLLAAPQHAP